ncbi:unnamed protein product, partial [Ascophyllum nodosum]
FTVDLVEHDCAEQLIIASRARLFSDDLALSAVLAADDPREQKHLGRHHKRLGSQVRHFDHDLWQKDCERIVPRGNIAILSQKDEIRLALGHIDQRRLAEACPHDTLWCTGLSAFNLRASFP